MREFFRSAFESWKKYHLLRKIERGNMSYSKLLSKIRIKQCMVDDIRKKYDALYGEKKQEKVEKKA